MTREIDYENLLKQIRNALKTAKKLGLKVVSGGGYAMSYDINNPPPYPVGLFGALSIVEGPAARGRLGLTFDETMSLEAGFNGKKKPRKVRRFVPELYKIGQELSKEFSPKLKNKSSFADYFEVEASPWVRWRERLVEAEEPRWTTVRATAQPAAAPLHVDPPTPPQNRPAHPAGIPPTTQELPYLMDEADDQLAEEVNIREDAGQLEPIRADLTANRARNEFQEWDAFSNPEEPQFINVTLTVGGQTVVRTTNGNNNNNE